MTSAGPIRLAVVGLFLAAAALGAEGDVEYIQEDVRLAGREIHAFEDDGESV